MSYLCQLTVASNLYIPCTQTNPRCREIQLFECLQFVECTRGSDVVILMGDFNTKPRHLAYSLLTKCMGLHDVFEKDPVDTCDLVSNIYTKKWMTPKRIDYIFYSDEFAAKHSLTLKVRAAARMCLPRFNMLIRQATSILYTTPKLMQVCYDICYVVEILYSLCVAGQKTSTEWHHSWGGLSLL